MTGDSSFSSVARAAVRVLDTFVRRVRGVREFTDDELCLLRIGTARSERDIVLSDGTQIHKGETIGELHLWNEHIPPMPSDGADFTWSLRAYSLLIRSFRSLLHHLADDSELGNLRAWRGESSFIPKGLGVPGLFTRLGFDVLRREGSQDLRHRFTDFWDNFYWWMLAWTFNPPSLSSRSLLKLERWQIWISTTKLQQKYGGLADRERNKAKST